jgi:uncharacterized protein YqjF (DUF2071 family)
VGRSKQSKIFLKANWLRLASANYIIDPSILHEHLPKGTELESHNGKYFISLVAFRYCETRLLNLRIPFHQIFEEVNLRFYVKREISRGKWRSEVAFTKLYFPKRALTFVARTMYKENYETAKMKHFWQNNGTELLTSYGLKKNQWHNIKIISSIDTQTIDLNSNEHFFSKHFWGTSQVNSNSATVYKIEHPEWRTHRVLDYDISFDFEKVFGEEFKQLSFLQPDSVHLFDGSEIVVNRKSIV